MTFLTSAEKATLTLVCDTLIPSLTPQNGDDPTLFRTSASDLGLPDLLEDALERVTSDAEKQQIKLLMRGLENGFVNGLLAQHWCPFSDMPFEAREAVLHNMATNRFEKARTAFLSFKRLATFIYYSVMPQQQDNPLWKVANYQLPTQAEPTPLPIIPYRIEQGGLLETEVLVIGSGAGGGVVAGELATAGYEVMVVEKGDYHAEADYDGSEMHAMEQMYEKYGALVNADTTMSILAGSVLGGGTTINWAASFRPPEHVLHQWEHECGFNGAASTDLQHSLDEVSRRINVTTDESHANGNNRLLEQGCTKLGYHMATVPRNVKGCEECGFCNFGCSFGAKQSTLKTYLQDAHDAGAKIVVRGHVERVLHHNGKVTGAMVTLQKVDGVPHVVTIRAKVVVLSAGTIHTPAIMIRSGLRNPNIGANLHLHPTTVTVGVFDEQVNPWLGPPIARSSFEFADLDGKGYGVWLENAPSHPGMFGLATAWTGARKFKEDVQRIANTANIIILTRDRDGGCIKVNKAGQPVIHYRISDYDRVHLLRGVQEALRVHVAAGATQVTAPQYDQPTYYPAQGNPAALEAFITGVGKRGLKPNGFPLFSAHQMSSCRIAGNPSQGVLSPIGESYEVRNLFVADGSVLPTAPGVNPMLTIMGVSHYIAQNIKALL